MTDYVSVASNFSHFFLTSLSLIFKSKQLNLGGRNSPECPTKLVVVHVWLGLPLAPPPGHLVRVCEPELARLALPADAGGVGRIGEQLQQKLPELNLAPRALGDQSVRGSVQQLVRIWNERSSIRGAISPKIQIYRYRYKARDTRRGRELAGERIANETQPSQTRFSGWQTATWHECQMELNAISQPGFTENQPQADINPVDLVTL